MMEILTEKLDDLFNIAWLTLGCFNIADLLLFGLKLEPMYFFKSVTTLVFLPYVLINMYLRSKLA